MDNTILNKIKEYFIDNESTKEYIQIISNAIERQKDFQPIIDKYAHRTIVAKKRDYFDFYTEMHHIIPKSIDPSLKNYKPNLIILTPREHFVCHRLLIDMCVNKHLHSMREAFSRMSYQSRKHEITPEEYTLGKKLFSEAQSVRLTGIPRSEVNDLSTSKTKHVK